MAAEGFTSYDVDADKRFRDVLKRAAKVSQDFRIPFGLILSDFYKSEQALFQLTSPGQYPDYKNGGPNSRYAKLKTKLTGSPYPFLMGINRKGHKRGTLAASMLGPNNPGSISLITNLSLAIGTSVKYGVYHQSDKPRSKIPLRKFLFIGPEGGRSAGKDQLGRLKRWLLIIEDHIVRESRKAGL